MIASPNKLYQGVRGTFATLASSNKAHGTVHGCSAMKIAATYIYYGNVCKPVFKALSTFLTTGGWGTGAFHGALRVWFSLKCCESIPPEATFKYCNQKYSDVCKTI